MTAQQQMMSVKSIIQAPLPADLVSIVAAATPVNGNLTIAAQPVHARKLQIRAVVGTPTTTAITAGNVNVSGIDIDGMPVSETLSIACTSSTTFKTANAYAGSVAISLSGYTAAGGGTGNTLGVGVSNDFGIPTAVNPQNFVLNKATKLTTVLGTSVTAADDNAGGATVDPNARTVAPTTAPSASGLINYEFTCSYNTAWFDA